MQDIKIYSPDTYISMPWRNGMGRTVELLKQQLPGDDGFAWRLSMADVASDGGFSNFTGYDRTLLLLKGNGITLEFTNGQRTELTAPLQAANFRGEEPTYARLHDGPITDFNIMTSRTHCRAEVISCNHPAGKTVAPGGDTFLMYAVGEELIIKLEDSENITLPQRHLLCSKNPGKQSLDCYGAKFIAARITYY